MQQSQHYSEQPEVSADISTRLVCVGKMHVCRQIQLLQMALTATCTSHSVPLCEGSKMGIHCFTNMDIEGEVKEETSYQ